MLSSFSSIGSIKKPIAVAAQVVIDISTGQYPVVVIGAGTNTCGRSVDGTSWTFSDLPFLPNANTVMCCGNVNSSPLWVVVGTSGSSMISTSSTNGTTWSSLSYSINNVIPRTNTGSYFTGISFGNGVFMACGFTGVLANGAPVAISSDGTNWVNGGTPFGAGKLTNNIAYANGYWVAVSNNSSTVNNVKVSTNVSVAANTSISWTAAASIPSDPLYGVIFNGKNWIIGSLNAKTFYSSTINPSSTYTQKVVTTPQVNEYIMTISANNNQTTVCGTWFPGGGNSRLYTLDTSNMTNGWVSKGTSFATRTVQLDFGSTSTFIGVGYGGNSAVISTNNGTSWSSISSVNTNMATGCYGVAFAK
jgi:hypothetical protein